MRNRQPTSALWPHGGYNSKIQSRRLAANPERLGCNAGSYGGFVFAAVLGQAAEGIRECRTGSLPAPARTQIGAPPARERRTTNGGTAGREGRSGRRAGIADP